MFYDAEGGVATKYANDYDAEGVVATKYTNDYDAKGGVATIKNHYEKQYIP